MDIEKSEIYYTPYVGDIYSIVSPPEWKIPEYTTYTFEECHLCQKKFRQLQNYCVLNTGKGLFGFCVRCAHEFIKEKNEKEILKEIQDRCHVCREILGGVSLFSQGNPKMQFCSEECYKKGNP